MFFESGVAQPSDCGQELLIALAKNSAS